MTTALAVIALAMIGPFVIVGADRLWIRIRMARNVAKLKLTNNTMRSYQRADNSNSNNRHQTKIHHRTFSFGPMKRLRA